MPKQLSTYSAAQRNRLLVALRKKALSTVEIRRDLDIMMPAARVFELKEQGHDIATAWINEITEAGCAHRVARYILRREAQV